MMKILGRSEFSDHIGHHSNRQIQSMQHIVEQLEAWHNVF